MGLLKTAATVAVASSVHGRVQRRQQARWGAQEQQDAQWQAPQAPPTQHQMPGPGPQHQAPAAPVSPGDMADRLANIAKLGELMNSGLITQAEFDQQKARILNG
jgi:putative oligomerization/nucleic acid binding protein